MNNLLDNIPGNLPEELVEVLASAEGLRIERIVSQGHRSPDGFWYDQQENELVVLVKGVAGLLFENRDDVCVMQPGDWIDIPAGNKHRTEWTKEGVNTVWLAIHYHTGAGPDASPFRK